MPRRYKVMEQNTFDFDLPFEEGIPPQQERAKVPRQRKKACELSAPLETEHEAPVEERITQPEPHIFTISELTSSIRDLLESQYADVWVTGEVSNFRNPSAKHYYFSLKDDASQLHAVIFGGRQKLSFDIEDGLELICHGRITVYNVRGEYQIVIDYCEPKGKGALQLAFEQLKKKLEAEGLFAKERKRPLPYLPRKIGVITSPTGAAIRDIIHVLTRRFPTIEILLIPVRVQGEGAAAEIAQAIAQMNELSDVDVMIVGRGGGSLEDLWAFNEEVVARAIFASRIPVISAVGHEIDFTIADFVADVRAPTPSAAAEIVVPKKEDLELHISDLKRQLLLAIKQDLQGRWSEVQKLKGRIIDPSRRFPDLHMRLDGLREHLQYAIEGGLQRREQQLLKLQSNLKHLSPFHILEKGYAVVVKTGSSKPIKSAKLLGEGGSLNIRFHEGSASAKVTKIIDG
jgi:exodeoxyribonuclease VII large subunit